MATYQPGDYLKLLAKPDAEARILIQVVTGDNKPLTCLPGSEANTLQGFFDLKSYAEAEVRMAKPGDYTSRLREGLEHHLKSAPPLPHCLLLRNRTQQFRVLAGEKFAQGAVQQQPFVTPAPEGQPA